MNLKKLALVILFLSSIVFIAYTKSNDNTSSKDAVKTETSQASATQTKEDLSSKLDELFTNYYGEDSFSGSVLIAKKDKIIFEKSYKMADFDKKINNTKDIKYEIASLTKQITALSIMQLQEKGLLKVEDTIDKYLPQFPHGNEITIHQLLTHTSGLPQHPEKFDIRIFRPNNTKHKSNKLNVTLDSKPGQTFEYSNTGYILLGYIIEKVSNKTLDEYFKENIFEPLDMKNTAFKDKNFHLDNLAVGYVNNKKDKLGITWYDSEVGIVRGSAGLCSTVEDLYKWDRALRNGQLISKESYEKMYTPYSSSYGYGWFISCDGDNKKKYFHYGVSSGYRSYIFRNATDDTTVIILSNYGYTPLESIVSTLHSYLD